MILDELWGSLRHDRVRVERLGEGIVSARLPTFLWSNYEQASQQGWPQRQSGDRVLIVDLRDNDGGSAGYGLETLKAWIDERRMVPFEDFGIQLTSSCLYCPVEVELFRPKHTNRPA